MSSEGVAPWPRAGNNRTNDRADNGTDDVPDNRANDLPDNLPDNAPDNDPVAYAGSVALWLSSLSGERSV
jgi:hypothetical protein